MAPASGEPTIDETNDEDDPMVIPGDPAQLFSDSIRVGFEVSVEALVAGQFTDDTRLDLAVSDGSMLHVLAQTGPRSFMLERSIPLPAGAGAIRDALVVADLNSDGHDDVAVNLGNAIGIAYWRDGGLDPLVTSHVVAPRGEVLDLAVGHFGTSGRADLVVLSATEVSVFTELASGGFSSPLRVGLGDWEQRSLALGDFDGDGLDDIVTLVAAGPVSDLDCMLVSGRPTGGFLPPVFCGLAFERPPQPTGLEDMVLANLDGDATDDLILHYDFPPKVSVLRRAIAETYNGGTRGGPLLIGDVDADGRPNVIVEDRYELLYFLAGSVRALRSPAEGIYAPERDESDPTGVVADLDGNGALDIVLGRSDGLHVLFQQRAGMTAEPRPQPGADACDDDAQALPVTGCDPQCVRMPEACNGQDDDCDGTVDEDATGYACGSALGECTPGQVISCQAGSGTCSGMPAHAESCDELDNDCDGQVDEGPECDPCAGDGSLPESVFATLDAHLAMLANVTCIQGEFQINGPAITQLGSLAKLEVVEGDMWIYNTTTLQTLAGLSSLSRVGRLFVRKNAALTSLAGIETLARIDTFHLMIDNNPMLRSLDGLGGLVHVESQVEIYENPELTDIRGLSKLVSTAYLFVHDNPKLPQCQVDELLAQIETLSSCENCTNNGPGNCTP